MRSNVTLGKIFGVEVGVHFSWLVIALMITLSLSEHFHGLHPEWGPILIWAVSLVTSAFFFASLLAHELSHAVVARSFGVGTRSITLFALGGVAQIESEAPNAKSEFWIGAIGPLSSAVIGLLCMGGAMAAGWRPSGLPETPLRAVLAWLGFINLGLAAFNLVPGFPLDGGRILRAILWWITAKQDRSTLWAARIGQAVGFVFIVLGVVRFFDGEGIGGLWISFIGWFLLQAAASSYATSSVTNGLRGVQVKDLMTRDCVKVDGRTNLRHFVDDILVPSGKRCFIVEEDNRILGLITPQEVSPIEQNKWAFTTIDDVMRPLEDLHTVGPDTPVLEALETMGKDDVNQLPVVCDSRVEGIITRGNVVQFLQARSGYSKSS